MKVNKYLVLAVVAVFVMALVGCRGGQSKDLSIKYDFKDTSHGWSGGFTDLPVDYDEDMYGLLLAHVTKPDNLGPGKALKLSGLNASDDLFMYLKKKLTTTDGIEANTTYLVRFTVEFATDAPAGAVGIGGPPGEAVWMKVGAAPFEPVRVAQTDTPHPLWVTNVDKGHQNEDGEHAIRIGDVAKVDNDEFDVYEMKTLDNKDRPLEVTSDANGNLWIFVGTDSGFEGRTTLYYTEIKVELEKKPVVE
ncbi:MAG: hypothetical protein R6W96_05890 [Clostridia bacterium]